MFFVSKSYFSSIKKHFKKPNGYVGVRDVSSSLYQCSQNVDVNGPHHRCFELIVSSSFNQPMAVERGRSHELVGSMVGAVYVHVLRTLHCIEHPDLHFIQVSAIKSTSFNPVSWDHNKIFYVACENGVNKKCPALVLFVSSKYYLLYNTEYTFIIIFTLLSIH